MGMDAGIPSREIQEIRRGIVQPGFQFCPVSAQRARQVFPVERKAVEGLAELDRRQLDDRVVDFVRVCDTRVGQPYRYGYGAAFFPDLPVAQGFMKYDQQAGNATYHDLQGGQGSEPVFVKDPEGTAEDDGWVMSYVHRPDENKGEVVIIDSRDFTGKPVARIQLPVRVPAGFHGNWVPDGY